MAPASRVQRDALRVGAAIALSRLLGLAREVTLSSRFAPLATDAFVAAFRLPDLLRNLLAEGALSAALVPAIARRERERGRLEALALVASLLNALALAALALALAMALFAGGYARFVAAGFEGEALALTGLLGRIMAPLVVTIALTSTLVALANARGRFFVPALASALFNVGVLIGGWLLAPLLAARGLPAITGMAAGAVLGGLLQLALQVPGTLREGYRHRLRLGLGDPELRRLYLQIGPAALALAATSINILIDTQIASRFGEGPVSWLFFAIRLFMLPVGVVGVALGTASLAAAARAAAAGERELFSRVLGDALRPLLLFALPAALALALLAEPIVRVVYQHGLFIPEATRATALALALYAIGLPGYALVKVLVPTFHALGDPWTPVRLAVLAVGAKLALSAALVPFVGWPGLALATALALTIHALAAWRRLERRGARLAGQGLAPTALVALVSALVSCGAALAALRAATQLWPSEEWHHAALCLAAAIAAGLAAWALVVRASGLPESRLSRRRAMRGEGPGEERGS